MDTTGVDAEPARLVLARSDDGPGRVRLIAAGEVDISNLEVLHTTITGILGESGLTDLIVDVGPLDFIDSAGVQVLLRAKQTASGQGIAYSVTNAHGKVLRVLTILNLHAFLAGPGAATAR